MTALIRYWLEVCLLRAAPQDGPSSGFILAFSMTCYLMISVLVLSGSFGMAAGSQVALVEMLLLAVFMFVMLYLAGKSTRLGQTLSAVTGAGSLLGLFSLPLVLISGPVTEDASLPAIISAAWLVLLLWNLLVSAHIIRHALSSSFATGAGVSVLYMVVSMQFIATLFPQLAV